MSDVAMSTMGDVWCVREGGPGQTAGPLRIQDARPGTKTLLLHAPYPGRLKFEAQPSSLLSAIGPYAARLAGGGRIDELGLLDPASPSAELDAKLEGLARDPELRVVCISTSTAAIEEAARAVDMVRRVAGKRVLVIAGGPHEDDVEEKMARRLEGVDVSIAGDAEAPLTAILEAFDAWPVSRGTAAFVARVPRLLAAGPVESGTARVSSRAWPQDLELAQGRASLRAITHRPWARALPKFEVFDAPATLPLMVSRGCSYGRCTFCAEAGSGQKVADAFGFVFDLAAAHSNAALYFQDSIFPNTPRVRRELLPGLKSLGREWGCQVYLRTLSRSFLEELVSSGCTYIYTGLESASEELTAAAGKPGLTIELATERFGWMRELGVRAGVSIMFGVIDPRVGVLETARSVGETLQFVEELSACGLQLAGVFPNVQTVLPGTPLARDIARAGIRLDMYRMPKTPVLGALEDGEVGYNFVTIPELGRTPRGLLQAVRVASAALSALRS